MYDPGGGKKRGHPSFILGSQNRDQTNMLGAPEGGSGKQWEPGAPMPEAWIVCMGGSGGPSSRCCGELVGIAS